MVGRSAFKGLYISASSLHNSFGWGMVRRKLLIPLQLASSEL